MLAALLPILTGIGTKVAGHFFPDPADALKRAEAEQKFITEILAQSQVMEQAAADIVKTEAASQHWLAANWRPLTMITFVALIVARWFGWAAPDLSEAEYLKLWDIVNLGLGGYVIGRSVEKIAPAITDTIKKR